MTCEGVCAVIAGNFTRSDVSPIRTALKTDPVSAPLPVNRSNNRLKCRSGRILADANTIVLVLLFISDCQDADCLRFTALVERILLIFHHVQRLVQCFNQTGYECINGS